MTMGIRSFVRPFYARGAALALVAGALVSAPGCTKAQLEGQSSSYLIVDSVLGARGDEPDKDAGVLDSDVVTKGSIYADIGRVTLRLGLKDPGTAQNPAVPTSANFITVTRYHVKYLRSDGRNTQGVDVPFEFDGGATVTVTGAGGELVVTLVRVQAKLESPLKALVNLGGSVAITTIAEITLYGKDQAGRDVSVKGAITVNFADFADPS
ncbi:MAG TPA: hypothetical protein VN700_09635 [Vicinamibacterales bacterium]|nr:hypothetical protein [Vicinamibacterales bacterium]